ncbi:MAG TPA: hypothetical protein VME20_03955 [Acidimicrobiales bacterium]|nr:hypothetical protein [Acidimicrobiales bacterium]
MATTTVDSALGDFRDRALAEEGLAPLSYDEQAKLGDEALSDEALTALALSADPDAPIAPGAVRLDLFARQPSGFLPEWYMPRVMAKRVRGWRVPVVYAIIAAFLLIDAFGLCITYGQLVAA